MKMTTKRILSLLLCFMMFVGLLPAGILHAEAAAETVYVLAGSDFQARNGHDAGAEIVSGLLKQVQVDYPTMDGFLFAGDYDVNYTDSANGQKKLQETVQAVYGTGMDEIYVQGNHDGDELVGTYCSPSGANDAEEYGVFVINEKDYMWYNDDEATIKTTAANLKTYLDAKVEAGYVKPIFVVSHLPLHYSMRTRSGGGDGMHANYIFDVLNEAGNAGLNIIFMFGHNHSHGWDDYLGGASIFLTKGDKINIGQNNKYSFTEETLAFTYMNAGYVGYYGDSYTSTVDKTLTMTAFAITDTTVTISRYDSDGTHDLKSSGVYNVEYRDASYYSANTATVGTPYVLTLNTELAGSGTTEPTEPETTAPTDPSQPETPEKVEQVDAASGVAVKAPGITGLTVTKEGKTVDGYSAYVSYDISPENYTSGDEAEVTIALDMTLFDASRAVLILDPTLGTQVSKSIIDGTVTFTTNHFSPYDVGQKAVADVAIDPSKWVTITPPTTAGTRYVYELDKDGIDTGVEYLIVANGYAKALSAAANSSNAVDITLSSDDTTAYMDSDNYGWTFTRYSNGVYYIRLNNNNYLRLNNGSLESATNADTDRRWTVGSNNDGSYDITRSVSGGMWWGSTTYNLRWSNSNGVFQASNSNEGPVRLYKYSKTETTQASAGLYGAIYGGTTYSVPMGTSKDAALAAVKEGITIYYTTDNAATTGTEYGDNADGMTWTCDTYNANTPGSYPVTIAYNGVELGTATIVVEEKTATRIEVSPMNGKVSRGSGLNTETGSTMTVTYSDGSTATIPVTLAMLEGSYDVSKNGTYTGLKVSYGGQKAENYTLQVVNVAGNDFPTYPNPGSVDVNKTAKGEDFRGTGLARVELSTSGLPAGQGVDVVVVIDTSSSMKDNYIGSKTRIEVLSESLEDMLTQFQAPNPTTGVVGDIDIAIIDFNGYFPSSAAAYDEISLPNGGNRTNADYAKVFTGTNAGNYIKDVGLSASNFVDNTSITPSTIADYFTNDNCKSGTNYDGALENAYKLLAAKKAANTEEREQYVIFLSDGAPFRYNGFNNGSTKSTYAAWDRWLSGDWANETALLSTYNNLDYSYFYNGNGTDHPHRIAEAIKGNENNTYDVVVREAANNDPAYIDQYQGLGATIYSIGFGLADDGDVVVDTQQELIRVISSGEGYYYENVQSAEQLTTAFNQIVTNVSYAATDAVFMDQMGSAFDLQMNPTVKTSAKDEDGNNITTTADTSITVTTQAVYTKNNAPTAEDVGKVYGNPTVVETVSFSVVDGSIVATSTAKTEADGNILNNDVIEAKTFFYNTSSEIRTVTLEDGSTYDLPGETFYWNIGTINEKQFTLSYLVYLTGSMEGEALPSDSYDTNNYATLSYVNHLGNTVEQTVPSPSMPWGGANVSYAFYLVDENGNPLLQNGTRADNFLTAYKVTQPVLYKTINLNAGETVLSAIGKEVLPDGYELYDETAKYTVNVSSSSGNSNWNIVYDSSKGQSTYVMGYAGAQDYTNATPVSDGSYDYTHTTVYFAVKWNVGTVPDTVVIDYGLPVDISVLANDMFGGNGTLAGVGMAANKPDSHGTTMDADFSAAVNGAYGTAKVDGDKVNYALNTANGMQMDASEKLAYAVNYTGSNNAGYYYGDVTIIPATTVYYEDNFLTLKSYTITKTQYNTDGTVKTQGSVTEDDPTSWRTSAVTGVNQEEDRPGKYSLDAVDANNIYGFDGTYENMSTHSLHNAAKITVNANKKGTAQFTFYGTGFDVISMTSKTTGTLMVDVYQGTANSGTPYKTFLVDTYYGMLEDGTISVNVPDTLYQVPVMKVSGLTYGQYTAVITAAYSSAFDHTSDAGYELYLDAIRIYDPAGTTYGEDGNIDQDIQNAYIADGEGWPAYEELRNNVIQAADVTVTENEDGSLTVTANNALNGVVFIDAADKTTDIADYVSYGPNNELYLAKDQAIAFNVAMNSAVADVQLGMKLGNGSTVTYTINGEQKTISTTTDMYYSILNYAKSGTVTIKNLSDGILSLTNIKVTYKQDPASMPSTTSLLWMDEASVGTALMSLRSAPVVDEEIPETTVPEETVPETTVPEETVPETTVPEETEPEETVPEETEPEKPAENPRDQYANAVKEKVKKALNWLFGWMRR